MKIQSSDGNTMPLEYFGFLMAPFWLFVFSPVNKDSASEFLTP